MSAASAPSAAASGESVTVERNSAMAATPSIDTVMKPTAPPMRSSNCTTVSGGPDSEVALPDCRPAAPTAAGSPTAAGDPDPNAAMPVR